MISKSVWEILRMWNCVNGVGKKTKTILLIVIMFFNLNSSRNERNPLAALWLCCHNVVSKLSMKLQITNYKSVSYQAAVWLSPAGGDGIESNSSPAPISPTSMSISYGEVGPTRDGLHSSSPWNESIGIGNVSYAEMVDSLCEN